jgi:hypothetical protein
LREREKRRKKEEKRRREERRRKKRKKKKMNLSYIEYKQTFFTPTSIKRLLKPLWA